jgi:hypothetical protein
MTQPRGSGESTLSRWVANPDNLVERRDAWLELSERYQRGLGPKLYRSYGRVPDVFDLGWDFYLRAIIAVEEAAREGRFEFRGDAALLRYLETTAIRLLIRFMRRSGCTLEQAKPPNFEGSLEEWFELVRSSAGEDGSPPDWDLPLPYCFFVVIVALAQLCRCPSGLEPRHHRFLQDTLFAVARVSIDRHHGLRSTPGLGAALVRSMDRTHCCKPGGDCSSNTCPAMAVLAITYKHVGTCENFLGEVTALLDETWEKEQLYQAKSRITKALQALRIH